MSDGSVRPVAELASRLQAVTDLATRATALRDSLTSDLSTKESEVKRLSAQAVLLEKVGELLRALIDHLVVKQVRTVEGVVTEGLSTIFHDLGLFFEAEISTKYNKVSVDFLFRQGAADDPLAIRGRPLDSFGGGPSAVADLILRMLTLLRLRKKPLLLLDETLASVSEEYVDATGHFLGQLAESMRIDVLLVTHKQAFLDHADRAYRCSEVITEEGTRRLELKSL